MVSLYRKVIVFTRKGSQWMRGQEKIQHRTAMNIMERTYNSA